MTKFYCFDTIPSDLPKEYVIVPPKVIGESTELDSEGNEVQVPVFEKEIHINTLESVEGWEDFEVFPESPRMIYG